MKAAPAVGEAPVGSEEDESGARRYHLSVRLPPAARQERLKGGSWFFTPGWLQEDARLPLYLDIGSGLGRFLLAEAEKHPEIRYLGVDPDYQCAQRVIGKLLSRASRGQLTGRVRFFFGSFFHCAPLLPAGSLNRVYLNYPDPWFKKRHLRRRLLCRFFFDTLEPLLAPVAEIFIQTDDDDYANHILGLLRGLEGYDLCESAEALFADLSPTLYQEKALAGSRARHCFHLRKI